MFLFVETAFIRYNNMLHIKTSCGQQETSTLKHNMHPHGLTGGDLKSHLDLALLRRVVRQAGGGDIVALLVLEDLALLLRPRLPLPHFDLQRERLGEAVWPAGALCTSKAKLMQ